jgi:hypothetical protein
MSFRVGVSHQSGFTHKNDPVKSFLPPTVEIRMTAVGSSSWGHSLRSGEPGLGSSSFFFGFKDFPPDLLA